MEFYDFAQSAPAALRLEATSRVASSWLFRFTCQSSDITTLFFIKKAIVVFLLKKEQLLRWRGERELSFSPYIGINNKDCVGVRDKDVLGTEITNQVFPV